MTDFIAMAAQSISLIYAVLALVISLFIYFAFKYQIDFWWTNFWYSIPIVGKLTRLSKDTTRSNREGWLNAEETLCGDYSKHIDANLDRESFGNRLTYMSKARDLGQDSLAGWIVAVLLLLLVAECLGFSYMLGTWIASEGSANVHTMLMVAIVLVICIIMLLITHAAGHELYRSGLIARGTKEWRDSGQKTPFITRDVKLDDKQNIDDPLPRYTQMANRVGDSGGYTMVVIAVAAILAIAVTSTWMRISHHNNKTIVETAVGNPYAPGSGLPKELVEPQREVDKREQVEKLQGGTTEALAAFLMLAVIFVVTQIVAIFAGYKFGFAGRESKAAYDGTRGFAIFEDYMNHFEPMIKVAQSKLQTLHQKLAARPGNELIPLGKTFDDYLHEESKNRSARQKNRGNSVAAAGDAASDAAVAEEAAPAVSAMPAALAEALRIVDSLADTDKKMAYLKSLQEPLKGKLTASLKARKEQQKREVEDQELKELF